VGARGVAPCLTPSRWAINGCAVAARAALGPRHPWLTEATQREGWSDAIFGGKIAVLNRSPRKGVGTGNGRRLDRAGRIGREHGVDPIACSGGGRVHRISRPLAQPLMPMMGHTSEPSTVLPSCLLGSWPVHPASHPWGSTRACSPERSLPIDSSGSTGIPPLGHASRRRCEAAQGRLETILTAPRIARSPCNERR